ncbi:hypothetical protein CVT24_005792 [Panaeolus cyanescens]|uniref:RWD domain-containing protein n=1 Tax=Panaeolus cyanescens TaxID=181874 RepID=A0A409V938_9AGAR|nr:hypothetical protein CVT24_005792 [Panaeolus cyanescens]
MSSLSPQPSPPPSPQHAEELKDLLASLSEDPDKEQVVSEIEVLQSIYGDHAIGLYQRPNNGNNGNGKDGTVRYQVVLSLPSPHEDVSLKVLVSLPPTYPKSSPPQLQLLSRYIGAFGADSGLFGSILRTYISVSGVEWTEDTVCVFDGLQNVIDRCTAWYEEHLSTEKAGALVREDEKDMRQLSGPSKPLETTTSYENLGHDPGIKDQPLSALPAGVNIYVAEPITDRKSAFVGRACRISHPTEVPLILAHLMSDRRIARAAHPIINAWRCQVDQVLHQDNDDDGETAAGGRLAHLLQILDVNDVLVVVTRYFGGIHLGPDRFKHINQAARNALELGGFLDAPADNRKNVGRGKKH